MAQINKDDEFLKAKVLPAAETAPTLVTELNLPNLVNYELEEIRKKAQHMKELRNLAREKCLQSGLFTKAIDDEDNFDNFFEVECSDDDIKRILDINMETGYRDRDENILHTEDDHKYLEDKMDFFNKMPFRFKKSTVEAM